LGAVVRQFTTSPTTTANGSAAPSPSSSSSGSGSGWSFGDGNDGGGRFDRNQRLVTAIVAGVLGALLLASLVAFAFSYSRARHLRRQVDRLQQQEKEALVVASSSLPPSSAVPSPLSARVRSLRINTQGLVGQGVAPHPSVVKDDIVSPMTHEQLHHLHQQQQQQQYSAGGVRRSSSSSFHQPPPPFTQQQQQQHQNQPSQQQLNGFSFNAPPLTPSWTHTGSFRHNSFDNNMNGSGNGNGITQGHANGHGNITNTTELASPLHVSELPTEKYTY
jgi:hypothetical protein